MTRLGVLAGTTALLCSFAAPTAAVPIIGDTLFATGGDVVVTFAANDAGYTSELFLEGPYGDGSVIFNNWTTPVGTALNLGTFEPGTELVFKLLVQQTGDAFFTGAADRNFDGQVHASIENVAGQVMVGFEDLRGGGDRDYNDLVFAFTNVNPSSQPVATTGAPGETPGASGASGSDESVGGAGGAGPRTIDEPSSLLMFGSGLAALVFVMKRQQTVRR